MKFHRLLIAPLAVVGMLGATTAVAGATKAESPHASLPTITIGNEGFTESYILQDIYGDLLTHAGYKVSLLAQASTTRQEAIPALEAGKIDVLPDYAGSLLVYLAPNDKKQAGTISTAIATLNSLLARKGAIALPGTAGLDQNVFVVTNATKVKYHLTTISSIKSQAAKWVFGAPPECSQNYFCLPGLKSVYGLKFQSVKSLDESGPLSVAALKAGNAQVVELFSTDNVITTDHFSILSDNLGLEPADHLIPVVRASFATTAVRKALASVNAALTTAELTKLDAQVSGASHPSPAKVAQAFLKAQKLI